MTDISSLKASFIIPGQAPSAAGTGRWRARLHGLLLFGFLLFTFVGTRPFAEADAATRTDGNVLDRIAVLGLFGLSLLVLWLHRWRVARFALPALPVFVLVGFAMASIVWSDFPDLTLRRSLLLFFLAVIAFAVAIGTENLRQLHTWMFATMTAIILINLAGCVIVPSIAISEIGVRGMYSQKNVAGIVALITMILGTTWVLGSATRRETVIGMTALVPTAFFLVITISKTSINLAALGIVVILFFGMIERHGRSFILFAIAVGLLLAVGITLWLATLEFDINAAMTTLIGDTSFTGRDELWAFARNAAEKRYWLGHGYGAFWDVGTANDPLIRAEVGSWLAAVQIGVINQAHHGYLELWLHLGLPATVLATVITIWAALYGGLHACFGLAKPATRAALGAFAVLLLLYLAHNLTEATLFMRGASFNSTALLATFLIARARDFAFQDLAQP
ncbi:MAG TPA: O-antigen ligase family protein [Beijerinckiaceae bacterium]|nr:O-antigen ligase family protein [Beijerinckiaceae bacterium]